MVAAAPVMAAGSIPDFISAGGQGQTASGIGPDTSLTGSANPVAQLSGSITMRDYPPDPAGARIGKSVLITFTVGTDGRAHDCAVREASGDPQADAITCRLAVGRFRFRPATSAIGQAIPAPYGWRQSWHD